MVNLAKEIPLTQGKVAIVDDDDYEALSAYKWCANPSGYALRCRKSAERVRDGTKNNLFMHKEIIKAGIGEIVDHANGDTLDNRKENLRLATHAENSRNIKPRSGRFKGIDFMKRNKKWRARVSINGKSVSLGLFSTDVEAARAYNEAAAIHYGEFARLNDIPEEGEVV